MFTNQQLATLQIRHLIIHDVPNSRFQPAGGEPTLSEAETELDLDRIRHLKNQLVSAIGSKAAYDVVFAGETGSPVPEAVRRLTHRFDGAAFVEHSRRMARHLHDIQSGPVSSGLLAVMDAAIDSRGAIVVMKIERQEGVQINPTIRDGRSSFAIEVLNNLVLTQGTRLFKAALFERTGDDDYVGAAIDSQNAVSTADDVAKFWLKFLGCTVSEQPRVRTARFYGTVVEFANVVVTDGVTRNTLYEHLVSEMKSQKRAISPRAFMEEYVPSDLRQSFRSFFEENQVPMTQFHKDTQDVQSKLKRRTLITTRGVNISAPVSEDGVAEEGLIEVGDEQIVVNDSLERVK